MYAGGGDSGKARRPCPRSATRAAGWPLWRRCRVTPMRWVQARRPQLLRRALHADLDMIPRMHGEAGRHAARRRRADHLLERPRLPGGEIATAPTAGLEPGDRPAHIRGTLLDRAAHEEGHAVPRCDR